MKVLIVEGEELLRKVLVAKVRTQAQQASIRLDDVIEATDLAEAGEQLQEADAVVCADSFPDRTSDDYPEARSRWRLVLKGLQKLYQMDGRERHFVLLSASADEATTASGKGIPAFVKPQEVDKAVCAVLRLDGTLRQTREPKSRISTTPHFTVEHLSLGDHLCCLWNKEEERRSLVASFITKGLERGERLLYFFHPPTDGPLSGYLRLFNLERLLAEGQFSVINTDILLLDDRGFTPDQMIELLCAETEHALSEGYAGLRVIVPTTRMLGAFREERSLIEYEARLNTFLPSNKCLV